MDLTDKQKKEISNEVQKYFNKHKPFLHSLTMNDLEEFKNENDLDSMSVDEIYMAASLYGILNGFMLIATQMKLKEMEEV